MEIRRFGIGHRRREGPAGTVGVSGQPIHSDRRGVIAELAFQPRAYMAPHSNPNATYFVVIEGGGFVRVGDEQARVAAGEAVVWPPDVVHAAWTELTPMRALVVEFALEPPEPALLLEGTAVEPDASETGSAERVERGEGSSEAWPLKADGRLAPRPVVPEAEHESAEREPW